MHPPRSPHPGIVPPSPGSTATTPAPSVAGTATIFESPLFDTFDGWAHVLRRAVEPAGADAEAVEGDPPLTGEPAAPTAAEAPTWTPSRRPPIALLHVVDDGRDSGETVRLRGDACLVGRTTGGVTIPHDPFLETDHARLDRLPGGGWLLTDLDSRDGTWVRATTARIRPGTSIRVGSTTLAFSAGAITMTGPSGVATVPLPRAPFVIGRTGGLDPAALPEGVSFVGVDDPHASPLHAEVVPRRGGLRIVNHGLNGLWVRLVAPMRLDATAQFQCGDQRFVLEQPAAPTAG